MARQPTAAEIIACLPAADSFARIISHETTGSTNDDVRSLLSAGEPSPALVAAATQSAGRGRRGNLWQNTPGAPLFFSVGLTVTTDPALRSMLSPAAAVALAETLEEFCQLPVGIKWPNDLVVEDRKVCGLLLESMPNGSIVIGVGLNLNTTDEWFEKNELPLASSISIDPADRTPLLAALASSLLGIEERVAESTELQSAFDRRDVLVGQVVHCMDGPTPHTGRVHEIDLIRGLTLDIDGDRLLLSPHTIRVLP